MKGINHGEEGNRHIIQVYYQHNLGKDNQARPCFFSAAGPGGWGGSGAGLAGLGGGRAGLAGPHGARHRTCQSSGCCFCLHFFLSSIERRHPISKQN